MQLVVIVLLSMALAKSLASVACRCFLSVTLCNLARPLFFLLPSFL